MSENASVVVFPSVFTKNKINQLESNIKKILKIKNQEYRRIKRDGPVIVIDANDPVFASSAINLLFGIRNTAIAKQVKNDFNVIISEITKIGSNLLLNGEKFYVKVEGSSTGFLPKDVEISATASIIEKSVRIGAKPGSEEKHDKLLYTYLTKSHAYVCVYLDEGLSGIPNYSQNKKAICAIYDELSAISCLETIKQGYDVKIIICYTQKSELTDLVKILNQILPRLIKSKINLDFFHIDEDKKNLKKLLSIISIITEIQIYVAKTEKISRISFSLSPLIFPLDFIESCMKRSLEYDIIPLVPLSGMANDIFETAKELGLGKHLGKIEKLCGINFSKQFIAKPQIKNTANSAIRKKKNVSVTIGPNNVHEILDALEIDH